MKNLKREQIFEWKSKVSVRNWVSLDSGAPHSSNSLGHWPPIAISLIPHFLRSIYRSNSSLVPLVIWPVIFSLVTHAGYSRRLFSLVILFDYSLSCLIIRSVSPSLNLSSLPHFVYLCTFFWTPLLCDKKPWFTPSFSINFLNTPQKTTRVDQFEWYTQMACSNSTLEHSSWVSSR